MRIHDFPLSTLAARRADRSRPLRIGVAIL